MRIDEVIQQPGMIERLLKNNVMKDTHVAIPGEVVSYDTNKKTATIQPTIRDWESSENPPLLLDVPVFMWGSFTFIPQPGDGCLVIFADFCIDAWLQNGGVNTPVIDRSHNMSDGFALVGFRVEDGTDLHEALDIAGSRTKTVNITASTLDQLKSKIDIAMNKIPNGNVIELMFNITTAFDVFPIGVYTVTMGRFGTNRYRGHGQVGDELISITKDLNVWSFQKSDVGTYMRSLTVNSMADFQTKLAELMATLTYPYSIELELITTVAFDVFHKGTHSFTIHKLADQYYWGYGFVKPCVVTIAKTPSTWTVNKAVMFGTLDSGNLITVPDGEYMIPTTSASNIQNLPTQSSGGLYVKAMTWPSGYRLYQVITYYMDFFIGRFQPGGSSISWFPVSCGVTNTSATRNTTNTADGSIQLYKTGRIVVAHVYFSSNANTLRDKTLFTIPEGFRPSQGIRFMVISYNVNNNVANMYINTNGSVFENDANGVEQITSGRIYAGQAVWTT